MYGKSRRPVGPAPGTQEQIQSFRKDRPYGPEGIQDKYINPYADFGFKLLFGTAMNKELFEAAGIAKSILRN